MKIIDAHAHLSVHTYKEELQTKIKEVENTMDFVINIGWSLEMSKEVLNLYKKHPKLIPAIGLHPNETRYTYKHQKELIEKDLIEFEKLISKDVIAIGEIGLDYFRLGFDKDLQKFLFIKQIEIAIKHKLPIIIHCRDAEEDMIEIISKYPQQKFLLHSWYGNVDQTKRAMLNKNIYFSVNGILTYTEKQNNMVDSSFIYEHDKVLCETDSPWLTPIPFKGQKNSPINVELVYKQLANNWHLDLNDVKKQINNNVRKYFGINESK